MSLNHVAWGWSALFTETTASGAVNIFEVEWVLYTAKLTAFT